MFIKTVNLWENTPGEYTTVPSLDIYLPENKTSDMAVVILPGGAYECHASHEGKDYADFFNRHGVSAFVLPYRVTPHHFPLPLLDARRAMRYVRYHSEELGIDKNKVYIMGSSAGGHLAALTSTYNAPIAFEGADEIDQESFRPDGQILCYPVIALLGKEIAHLYSGYNLLGKWQASKGEELSPHLIADSSAPPAFIWHTFTDEGVNVTNTLLYAQRLRQVNVNAEVHIYPHGKHGLGLATDIPRVGNWTQELLQWLGL